MLRTLVKRGVRRRATEATTCPKCKRTLDLPGQFRCPFCGEVIRSTRSLSDAAVWQFGEAEGPSEGGFLLGDGRWIELGEGTDHRAINYVVPDRLRVEDSPGETMTNFMIATHAIRYRVFDRGHRFFLDVNAPVQPAQVRALRPFFGRGELDYDIDTVDNEEGAPFKKSGSGWEEFVEIMLPYIVSSRQMPEEVV